MKAMAIMVGIDVGGVRKGFHAVALESHNALAMYRSTDADEVSNWIRELGPEIVAIDAPCRWSVDGRARLAERQLMAKGIWCFSSPTCEDAQCHPTNYFGWMRNGANLFEAIHAEFKLYEGSELIMGQKYCFETFPHAIACAIRGEVLKAKNKRVDRLAILERAGMDTLQLKNIDWIDAALCAYAAQFFSMGDFDTYGDVAEGFIVTPKWRVI